MKWLLIVIQIVIFSKSVVANDITNKTASPMRCVANYPREYKETLIKGIKKRTKVKNEKEVISELLPGQTASKERIGTLTCYNEFAKISSFKDGSLQQTNKRSLQSHLAHHNMYDISLYQGKDRDFVEKNFTIAQRCSPIPNGEYCNHSSGLDIIYDDNNRINSVLLYGSTVQNGRLPFQPESLLQLRSNRKPLGFWVIKNYQRIFNNPPSVWSHNLMLWENPTKNITKIIVTSKNGYFNVSRTRANGRNLFLDGYNEVETGKDYIQAIEVQYK